MMEFWHFPSSHDMSTMPYGNGVDEALTGVRYRGKGDGYQTLVVATAAATYVPQYLGSTREGRVGLTSCIWVACSKTSAAPRGGEIGMEKRTNDGEVET